MKPEKATDAPAGRKKPLALPALLCVLCLLLTGCHCTNASLSQFDPEAVGLVMVETEDESTGKIRRYAVAAGKTAMEIDAFDPDDLAEYIVPNVFTLGENRVEELRLLDAAGREVPVTREAADVCYAMKDVGHDVLQCRVFRVGDEIFVSAMLNVNLWTPYRFYYYDQASRKLIWLYTFANEDVTAIRVLSRERLAALDQETIGGEWPPDPVESFSLHAQAFDQAADMLLSHADLFEEMQKVRHTRSITANGFIRYDNLTNPWGISAHVSQEEQDTLLALTDLCLPRTITCVPGEENRCAALLFTFSVFDFEEDRAKDLILICLEASDDAHARSRTVQALTETYGELSELPCDPHLVTHAWLTVSIAPCTAS